MRSPVFVALACLAALAGCETETGHETIEAKSAASTRTTPPAAGDSATSESFLAIKAQYQAKARAGNAPRAFVDSAMRDLDTRLRAIVGPVSFGPTPAEFNPAWLYRDGTEGGELDALRFGSLSSDPIILVTTEKLLAAWVRAEGDTASDPFVGLSHENVLTWALNTTAHATVYADIRRHATMPPEIGMALLITHSQDPDLRSPPREIVVGVRRGARVFVIFAGAVTRPSPPAECVTRLNQAIKASLMASDADEKAYLECYDRLAPEQPEFRRVVDQVEKLADLVPRE